MALKTNKKLDSLSIDDNIRERIQREYRKSKKRLRDILRILDYDLKFVDKERYQWLISLALNLYE